MIILDDLSKTYPSLLDKVPSNPDLTSTPLRSGGTNSAEKEYP